jgi:REP element-mobilizing transposase RayT
MKVVKSYRGGTTRLRSRNYDEGGPYFVTICILDRRCDFGVINRGELRGTPLARIAETKWHELPQHHRGIELDEFVIMPNHLHGILWLPQTDWKTNPKRTNQFRSPASGTLGSIIRSYKSAVSKLANEKGFSFSWQPRFWDHAIRGNDALLSIREYIWQNPLNWDWDSCNPAVAHLYED